MKKLNLSFSCWEYDRTRALLDGKVQPDGIDLTYLNLPIEETFFRMPRYREFDVSEMSLSSYVVSLFSEDRPFVAIPVFPSRYFRHSCIFVNKNAGISKPGDLVGKRIGVPEFQMTAPVWIRGLMAEEYGVPVDSVTYFTGGEEQPGRYEKMKLSLPDSIKVQPIGPEQTLSRMLETGEIDALHTARAPSTFRPGGNVVRLFEDFPAVEREYYARTGIFPIMHTVVIRREIYEKHRWVAGTLFKAFREAQQYAYRDLAETAGMKVMLPWLPGYLEETIREMGGDFWPYGLDKNRETLKTFLRYSHEQGLSKRQLDPEDLFAPETLDTVRI